MSIYGTLKHIYKKLFPKSVRHTIFLITPRPINRLRHNLIGIMEKMLCTMRYMMLSTTTDWWTHT